MKQKQTMGIYTCIWIVAIVILIVSLFQNLGYAKVINYSGIVRGATQKLVKEELQCDKDDTLIVYLDNLLDELQTGHGEHGLMKLEDKVYQQELNEMNVMWQEIKLEIQNVRHGQSSKKLYQLSQEYFQKADHMVATAQNISDQSLAQSIVMFFLYLLMTGGIFLFWYRHKQKQIQKVMYIDKLTGIYNLLSFEIEVQKQIENQKEFSYVLICFDIDDFKFYNTIYGYAFGDKMLQSIAKGLQLFINHNGICARSNSDCFYALVSYHDGIAEDLRDYLKVVMKEDLELDIIDDLTMSFGMYMVTQNEVAQDILDYALLAHKNAKAIGKNCMIWYDQNLLDRLNQDNLILKQMYRALAQHQFQMYLQPQFEVSTLKIIGAEALVRWKMDNGTFLYPDDFISLFEKDGYIYELDFEILEQACRFIKTYNVASDFSISVNFSRVTIHHKQFYQRLHDVLEKYKTPIGNIEIEITESAFHDLSNGSRAILLKLREEGFTIAMDDFGSGYSSLNLLDSISVDVLKIDKFFLVERSQKREMIIGLIVDIAKTLDMKVICEGVETEDDIDLLRKLNCPLGQGYYISKPILAQQFAEQFLNHEREIHG